MRIEWIGNKLRRVPADLRRRVVRMRGSEATKEVAAEGCLAFDDVAAGVAFVLAVVVLLVLMAPLAWGLIELLLAVVLGALVWAFRVLFRRPWCVVHRAPGDVESASWRVVGWREAHRVMVEAAESIERSGAAQVSPPTAGWAGGGAPGVS